MPEVPGLERELALYQQGYRWVAGLDEAGRGAWAGPVVAAAVMLPAGQPEIVSRLAGLHDSKKLTPPQREQFFDIIAREAVAVGVGWAGPEVVDRLNVVGATRLAMGQAVAALEPAAEYLLIDHLPLPELALPQEAFPRADGLSLSVAAASVVAKVSRDRFMVDCRADFPGYAFERHKGYGTTAHRQALARLGPCRLHRLSYEPVRQARLL